MSDPEAIEPSPPTMPEPTPSPGRSVAVIGALAVLVIGGMIWWLRPRPGALEHVRPIALDGTALENSPFVGSKACKDCHPGEYAAHSGSGHARTLRPAGSTDAAKAIDGRDVDDPERPGVRWHYRREGKGLIAERVEGSDRQPIPLEFALGSGQHAVTFVSLLRDGKLPPSGREHRLTYFAHSGTLGLTPGQAGGQGTPGLSETGILLPPPVVLDCFECHGTRTSAPRGGGLAPETLIPNVSCERCHGPGRAHAEAALSGIDDPAVLAMPFGVERATAGSQIAMCGRCHRLPEMVANGSIKPENAALARFPSVGLLQSACFKESKGTLSCTTCHDPHGRVSTDMSGYEATCRSCHSGARNPSSTSSPPGAAARTCPVNPLEGCVGCHMPRRDAGSGLKFSDHWTRADRK